MASKHDKKGVEGRQRIREISYSTASVSSEPGSLLSHQSTPPHDPKTTAGRSLGNYVVYRPLTYSPIKTEITSPSSLDRLLLNHPQKRQELLANIRSQNFHLYFKNIRCH